MSISFSALWHGIINRLFTLVRLHVSLKRFYNPYFVQPAEGWKEHNCIPDEHYVQTLLAVSLFYTTMSYRVQCLVAFDRLISF